MTAETLATLVDTLRAAEGYRYMPYTDTEGVLTIGIGRAIGRVGISRDEAELMLANDVSRAIKGLDMALPWWSSLDEVRQAALAEMAFQLGVNGVLNFRKMRDALMVHDYDRAADEALNSRWHVQTPKRCERIARMLRTGQR